MADLSDRRIYGIDDIPQESHLLEVALGQMDQGFSISDGEQNVLIFNRRYLDLLDLPPDRFKPGFHLSEVYRYNAERGWYGEGSVDKIVEDLMESLAKRLVSQHYERTRPDGIVLEIYGEALAGGGFVTKIAEQKYRSK